MPICYITLSESVDNLSQKNIDFVRIMVADGLDSKSRKLDRNHIVIRLQRSQREFMLADIEIDIFAQFYIRRYFSRDKRAELISRRLSQEFGCNCATWINMNIVGYARVNKNGESFFSD